MVVANLQPARSAVAQGRPSVGIEDHRVTVAVRVERPTERRVVASTLLVIDMTGVIPLPPQNASTGRSSLLGAEHPGRLGDLENVARRDVVEEPVGDEASGDALHGDGQVVVRLRGARHRVGPQLLGPVDVDPERAELAGRVAEGLRSGRRGRRARTSWRRAVSLHDLLDPQLVVAVMAEDGVVPSRSRRRQVFAGGRPGDRLRLEVLVEPGQSRSAGRCRCACSRRRACRPARSASRR